MPLLFPQYIQNNIYITASARLVWRNRHKARCCSSVENVPQIQHSRSRAPEQLYRAFSLRKGPYALDEMVVAGIGWRPGGADGCLGSLLTGASGGEQLSDPDVIAAGTGGCGRGSGLRGDGARTADGTLPGIPGPRPGKRPGRLGRRAMCGHDWPTRGANRPTRCQSAD